MPGGLQITWICFGKLKTPGVAETFEHYFTRIQPFLSLQMIELKASSGESAEICRKLDEELFLRTLSSRGLKSQPLFLLDERGKALPTQGWATWMENCEGAGSSSIVLGMGGSFGLSETLRLQARGLFSLGPQTLPHELARVVMMEQLYRAASLRKGHPYHHS